MYIFCGLIFFILAILFTAVLFIVPLGKMPESNISLFVITTILLYLIAIVSFGIESICDRLDNIKHKIKE